MSRHESPPGQLGSPTAPQASPASLPVYINGRFLTQGVSGVQRFAHEMVRALDEELAKAGSEANRWSFTVLAPRGTASPIRLSRINIRTVGRLQGHLWEQLELPFHARRGLLLNLCNTGPLLPLRQLVVLHDAAVFSAPQGYTWAFVAWYRVLFTVLARTAARVLTVSEFSRRELSEHLGLRPDRVGVLLEGKEQILRVPADPSILDRHRLRDRPFLLAVSSLNPNKNFSAVTRAIELLGERSFDFVVAGARNARVFSSGAGSLPAFVKEVGYVTDAELRALYENAACFAFPSRYEGFGLPALEAMACGCPVIAARAASIPEVCDDAALYFDPDRPEEVAARIEQVMGSAELRDALRGRGLARADRFSWEASARQIVREIERVVPVA
jgi:glycosyltransferase involved in cell wall biosynthesis